MNEIYVMKDMFDHYKAVSLKEIEALADNGSTLIEVTITMESPEVIVHLYENILFISMFGLPEGKAEQMVNDYLKYVASITGMTPNFV